MEAFQRSTTSFRRQGSSGLVWDDKQFLSGELKPQKDHHHQEPVKKTKDVVHGGGTNAVMRRSRSDGGTRMYRTPVKAELVGSAADPPSPKVQACGFCSVFWKSAAPANKGKKQKQKQK